jgi:uncharacterized protein YndB with AHSA1/START domain
MTTATTDDHQEQTMTGATTLSTPSDREIVSQRVFDAPREHVFAAFTDPDLIPRWWGPRRMTTIVEHMDVRPGGTWRFIARDPEGREQGFRGTYREVTPPERLVQTFEWDGMPGHVVVETVSFEDLDGKTKLTTTSLFHTTEERDGMLSSGMETGLSESHDRLAELLSGQAQ